MKEILVILVIVVLAAVGFFARARNLKPRDNETINADLSRDRERWSGAPNSDPTSPFYVGYPSSPAYKSSEKEV